jgi:cytochrome c553
MKSSIGSALLALVALLFTLAIGAPAQQSKNTDTGLPWAYGFATPAMPAAAAGRPGGGGGGGAAGGGGAGGGAAAGGAGGAAGAAAGAAAAGDAAEPPEDREKVRSLSGSTAQFNIKQISDNYGPADWFPGDHPQMPDVVAHGRKPDVPACGFCHYPNGKGRPNNAGPAGLPAGYILQQLDDFKDGARKSWDPRKRNTAQMIAIAKGLNDEDKHAAAEYFASMKWTPWVKVVETDTVPKAKFVGGGGGLNMPLDGSEAGKEPLGQRIIEVPANPEDTEPLRSPRSGFIAYVPVGSIKRGEELATKGGEGKTVACAACHGVGLHGSNSSAPSLAGRSPSYLARQLLDIQHYTRNGPGGEVMRPVVEKLSEDDILAITAYVASLTP